MLAEFPCQLVRVLKDRGNDSSLRGGEREGDELVSPVAKRGA